MKYLIPALMFLFVSVPASAVVIIPPLVNGEYVWKTLPNDQYDADGVPIDAPTRSIAMVVEDDSSVLGCTNVDPDVIYDASNPVLITTNIAAPVSGNRVRTRAIAFADVDCGGEQSVFSDEFGAVFFGSPRRAIITE